MKLHQIMGTITSIELVTIADFRTADILVDCQVKDNIIEGKQYEELREMEVASISVGKDYHDLIILVSAN